MQLVAELLMVIGTGFLELETSWLVVFAMGRVALVNQANVSQCRVQLWKVLFTGSFVGILGRVVARTNGFRVPHRSGDAECPW